MGTPKQIPPPEHLRAALRVSVVSGAWTVASSSAAVASGILAHALVLVVFGLTGVLDAAGSWALALHFKHALAHARVSEKREHIALRVVSVGLISIGVFTIEESARRLATDSRAHSSVAGVAIAAASIIVLASLAARKRQVSRLVGSDALRADGWLSTIGAALAVIAIVGTALGARASWVDPVTALLVAVIACSTGIGFLRREEREMDDG